MLKSPKTHRGEVASCASSAPMTSQSWSCTAAGSTCTASRLEDAFRRETRVQTRGLRAGILLTGVLPRMSDEGGGDGEGHAAQIALVRLLPGVAPLVVGERAGLGEGLTADVTDVRLLAAVQPARKSPWVNERGGSAAGASLPDVYLVVGRCSELESAALARVRLLLAVVHPPVSHQLTLLSKALVTVGAVERLLPCQTPPPPTEMLGNTRRRGSRRNW